jgi:hypothetical protein
MVIKYNGDVIPCCSYRLGQQYTGVDDPRVFGNVFESSIRRIWNSPHYHRARRMVSEPDSTLRDPALKQEFCYGCGVIFESDEVDYRRQGPDQHWDNEYELGEDRRPRRKSTVTRVGLPSGEAVVVS